MSEDRIVWRRVAVIVPSSNTTVEADFLHALPVGITLHAARIFLAETTAEAERRMFYDHVPIAIIDLATLRPHVVGWHLIMRTRLSSFQVLTLAANLRMGS